MRIEKILIENFRSIESTKIEFENDFKILIGKNEAGKSNILSALTYLDTEKEFNQDDIREPLPDEDEIEESTIGFRFSLDKKGLEDVFQKVKEFIYTNNYNQKIIKDYKGSEYNIKNYCAYANSGIHTVDLLKENRKTQYYTLTLEKKWTIIGNWYKLKEEAISPIDESDKYEIFDIKVIDEEHQDLFEPITREDFTRIVGNRVINYIKSHLPEVLFWTYKEENLLPSSIPTDGFIADIEQFIPLKNMFHLAGIEDIEDKLNEAKEGRASRLENLLGRVAEKTTNHFKEIWPEYKKIKFSLLPNGANIEVRIQEKNKFHLDQRSDGFKRFITFLLYISATEKSNHLSDRLILIDEPDLGLHPSGVKLLRDRLIGISKSNQIVISTHSIFMIDNDELNRHYIIKKVDEKTDAIVPNDDNIATEEVLFRSLGHSIYDSLKSTIILFEGWKDKSLFKTAISSTPKEHLNLKKEFSEVGLSHSKGVKHIKNLTPFFELAERSCFILSDNDKPAIEKQKEFKKEKIYGTWLRYDEVDSKRKEKTGEDFLKTDYLDKVWSNVRVQYNLGDDIVLNHSSKDGVISSLQKLLTSNKTTDSKQIIDDYKNQLFDNLKRTNINESYYSFLQELSKKMKSL